MSRRLLSPFRAITFIAVIGLASCMTSYSSVEPKSSISISIVVPLELNSFEDRQLELKLYRYDKRVADKPAKLVAHAFQILSHKQGVSSNVRMKLPKQKQVNEDDSHYLTTFITDGGRRTHVGTRGSQKGLIPVLPDTFEIELSMKPVSSLKQSSNKIRVSSDTI